jgi:Domain of unknown function (DUF4337)
VEARESFERFEASAHAGGEVSFASQAALVVAILAAFLAVATFKANESVKDAIQSQTKVSDTHAQYQTQVGRQIELELSYATLNAIAINSGAQAKALSDAADKLNKTANQLDPVVKSLDEEATKLSKDVRHDNHLHLLFELAEVGLQIGIVLASVSIITRRRWLLGGGGLFGIAGVVILVVGFLA